MLSNTNYNSRKYSDPFSKKYIYIYNCSFYFANLLLLYGSVSSLLFDIYSLPCLKIQASGARHNDDFLLNTLKTPWAIHSRRRYKICIRWVILRELESFRNYKGFSIIFPKILEAIWRFTRARIFLIPLDLSITFLNSKFLGFLFLQKIVYDLGSEIWKIKLQKIVGILLEKFRKLYMSGMVI